MSRPLLAIDDLSVHYGAIRALHGISITVEDGEIVTLIGANGAGKSTTLRAVSALCRCSEGTITFDGRNLAGLRPHQVLRLGLAQVPEGRGIFPNLTVDENLDLGAFARKDAAAVASDRDRVFG
ncbi:MAG TPA: ATP-binding cassette domain-containing protein, partial [Candidatus Sulfotelmatobacter sp.]|nr:ATP-binding cassette domain-containing protein [Candidatus Sulfotelmatobacter sp.]